MDTQKQPLLGKMFGMKQRDAKEEMIRLNSCLPDPQVRIVIMYT